jgi:hypothetical protein
MSQNAKFCFFILLISIHFFLNAFGQEQQQQQPAMSLWDPTYHGITPEAKRQFENAVAKGDIRKANQIRQMVAQEIVNAFWAG